MKLKAETMRRVWLGEGVWEQQSGCSPFSLLSVRDMPSHHDIVKRQVGLPVHTLVLPAGLSSKVELLRKILR